ncbi:YibE/F family protein [Nocardioides xinjiangensis]|uniref:YibE/F family protein n=1 Tax=Nocardioides xinjiangensis TaxID=2817376 RepID=UPI001B31268A|nr:YibE/F family protein [Nocardioides sp. SYSU D00778]
MGAGHGHGERSSLGPAPRRLRVLVGLLLAPLVLATLVGLLALWPDGDLEISGPGVDVERGTARVQEIVGCPQDVDVDGCELARVELLSGPGAPAEAEALLPYGDTAPEVVPGDRIIVSFTEQAPEGQQYAFQDFDRGPPLLTLTILFAVGVLALSRWRGIGALASLAYSLVLIAVFTLPAIMEGSPPLAVAVTTAAAIMLVTLYLSHGFDLRSTVAMLGTLVALVVIGGIGWVFTRVGHFTGLVDEGSQYISGIAAQVDLRGLLLAGLVIGALGVLDDVTVTQTWAVWELADVDPDASARSLFVRAMRIGRSHVASTVNTLVLAYVGATLPLMLVFSALSLPFGIAVSQEVVAQEVVRGLVGGLGIIAAVPVTTGIAALVAGRLARDRSARDGSARDPSAQDRSARSGPSHRA